MKPVRKMKNGRRAMTGAATFLLAAAALSAASAAVDNSDAAKVPAGVYEIDSTHSSATARVDHMGFSYTSMTFNKMSGSLSYDPANPAASSLNVTIDVASGTSGFAPRDEHLRGPQFFNAAAFPTMHYTAKSLTMTDATHARINGELTLLGVTKPVVLDATLRGSGTGMTKDSRVGFAATAHLRRSDFGMTTFLPMISDNVDIIIDTEFSKK